MEFLALTMLVTVASNPTQGDVVSAVQPNIQAELQDTMVRALSLKPAPACLL